MKTPRCLLSVALVGFSIAANATTYPFEGYWAEDKHCSTANAVVQYTAEYMRVYLNECSYTGVYGKVEQLDTNHWRIQATCFLPVTVEDEDGETRRHHGDVDALIELELNDQRLSERLVLDHDQYDPEPQVSEYYRCNADDDIQAGGGG